ncbi:putative exosome complex component RRP43 [Apostichopus japonicus]|uniref:Ribosomal RNA-processing protein 43 n=1 Tax=Stichopus japonicus TaxID=307972 RepID=A0A2G8KHV5_STIJA|nr:putative exosome complex component RRP43 [Apostichopus japonicus]
MTQPPSKYAVVDHLFYPMMGTIGNADGSALVKLGNTTVICGIKAEFSAPLLDEPTKGYLVPNVELPPLCSSQFKSGPPGDQAQVVSQLIDNIVKSSKLINLESLCIAEGTLCWVLHCDMICLDYEGNVVDACLLSLLAALKNVLLPDVRIVEDSGLAVTSEKSTIPLDLSSHPVSTSFVVFDDSILLADPTKEEETMATGVVTIVTTEDGNLCAVHKPGGSPLPVNKMQDCIARSKERANKVRKLLEKTFKSSKG